MKCGILDISPAGPPNPTKEQAKEQKAKNRERVLQAVAEFCGVSFDNSPTLMFLQGDYAGAIRRQQIQNECLEIWRWFFFGDRIVNDPPDPDFNAVALPAAITTPPASCSGITHPTLKHDCRKDLGDSAALDTATSDHAAIVEAESTAMNRLSTAITDGSATGSELQDAVLEVLSGEELSADRSAAQAAAGLSAEAKAEHLSTRIPAKVVAETRKTFLSGKLPSFLVRGLKSYGISPKEFTATVKAGFKSFKPKSVGLSDLAVNSQNQSALRTIYDELSPSSVATLVNGLGSVLTSIQVATLRKDATALANAAPGAARTTAAEQLSSDARAVGGEAAKLIETAAARFT